MKEKMKEFYSFLTRFRVVKAFDKEWSLIKGMVEGGYTMGGGWQVKFYPCEKEGGSEKVSGALFTREF